MEETIAKNLEKSKENTRTFGSVAIGKDDFIGEFYKDSNVAH